MTNHPCPGEGTRALTWSYGGGTQSVAIACLVAQGKLPKPDCAVIADTSREASETWEYTDQHIRPMLARVGVEIHVAPHSLATVDLYSHKGELLLPAYTATGALPTYCSGEWKRDVVSRFLRAKGYGPSNPVQTWIGISLDEIGRVKPSRTDWQENGYPLLDAAVPLRRSDCVSVIREAGLPKAPKSSCWMCPYRRNRQWAHLRDNRHRWDDFDQAVALDEDVRKRDEMGGVWLHEDRVPLKDAKLDTPEPPMSALFGEVTGCDSGYCWV